METGPDIELRQKQYIKSVSLPAVQLLDRLGSRVPMALLASVVATSAVSELRAESSIEIEPTTSWEEGVGILNRDALHQSEEVLVYAVISKSGEIEWLSADTEELGEQYGQVNIEAVLEHVGHNNEGEVAKICMLHTHPLEDKAVQYNIPTESVVEMRRADQSQLSIPPSNTDIMSITSSGYETELRKYGYELDKDVVRAVIDPSGIWYYRPLTEGAYQNYDPKLAEELERAQSVMSNFFDYLEAISQKPETFEGISGYLGVEVGELSSEHAHLILLRELYLNMDSEFANRTLPPEGMSMFSEFNAVNDQQHSYFGQLMPLRDQYAEKSWKQGFSSDDYEELRAMYARNGTEIRYVPIQEVSNEEVCQGFD